MAAQLPPIVTLTEFENAVIEPPSPILEGLLERGSKLMLVGGSKANKSWLMMDLAISVSQGLPDWLGIKVTKGKVLYLNFELHSHFFRERLRQIRKARNITSTDGDNLEIWNLRGCGDSYKTLVDNIKKRIGKGRYVLVIIDPIYKFYADSTVENAADGVANLLNAIESIAHECETAIAYAHHTPKGDVSDRDTVDMGSGSGVFGRDPDAIVSVLRETGHKDRFKAKFVLRYHPPKDDINLLFEFPLMQVTENQPEKPAKTRKGGRPKKCTDDGVLECLNGEPLTDPQWFEIANTRFDIERRTFAKSKGNLLIEGRAIKNTQGLYERAEQPISYEIDL